MNVVGNVNGNILAGGNITNVRISGNVNNILAGTATNGVGYNFTGNLGGTSGVIAEDPFPVLKPGASITDVSVSSITAGDTIHAGDGGFAAVGGAIARLTVLGDTNGYNILAGNGGYGNVSTKGGVGGNIDSVTIVGVALTANNQLINIQAGHGGDNSEFKGGVGGTINGLATNFDNFDPTTSTGTQSADLLTQNILVHAGDGGSGLKGGRGGDVLNSSVYSGAPDDGVVTNGVANPEIQVSAGHGGVATTAGQGHGGNGGNITQLDTRDLDTFSDAVTSTILVQAGDGGAAKNGGSIASLQVLGGSVIVNAGNGADGILTGGLGGGLNTISILNLSNVFAHQVTLNAGSGGSADQGPGGAGGLITTVTMLDSDLNLLVINGGTHANGGTGNGGAGGVGGTVTNVQLNNSDVSGQFANVQIRSGVGGGGQTGGGDGGSISQFQMFGLNYAYAATAGSGGSIVNGGAGAGGQGGGFDTVGFSSVPSVNQIFVGQALTDVLMANYAAQTGSATAGNGGDGTTTGGLGGSLLSVNLRASYDVTLNGGKGGAGGNDAGGNGGSITNSAGVSLGGGVFTVAGNAAGAGALPTSGGNITNFIASAQTNISMIGGSGGVGGTGGSIATSGTTPNPLYFNPTFNNAGAEIDLPTSNFGNTTITAGAGSSAYGVAGAGGSITTFNGFVGLGGSGDLSSVAVHTTAITAGVGGGGDGLTASGAGGKIGQLQLAGTNSTNLLSGQIVTVDGGAAGQATAAKRGADGGNVANAIIYNLDAGTNVQHIAAGDGSNAVNRGGTGGTVNEVHVGRAGDLTADIGVRSGAAYGYGAGGAGGIFAGLGGTGRKSTGAAGSVTNITANAIASIVAGKGSTPGLVSMVDNVKLAGNTASFGNPDGSFGNFGLANLVGSVQNPIAPNASTFKQGDGLVAALVLTDNVNFTPEAFLTLDGSGNRVLVDYQQPNQIPVTISPAPAYLS